MVDPPGTVRLLGRFELRLDGEDPTPLTSARAESVLALLLLEGGGPLPRASVASAIWPDSTEGQARTNLRHVLHDLRRGLPSIDRFLEVRPDQLRLRPEVRLHTDVALLEGLLSGRGTATEGRDVARLHALREAAALGAAELLEDHDDEWLRQHRERLRRRVQDAIAELATLCERAGAVDEAVRHAERLQRADPLREDAYRLLMRLHAARGDRARAARVYHQCASTLGRELGIEPSRDTRAAYDALLPSPVPARREAPEASTADAGPLVGRRRERGRLEALWRGVEAGGSRFVLISGDPGIGKSRLAEDVGTWCRRRGARVAQARCHLAEGPLAYGVATAWLRAEAVWPAVLGMDPSHVSELARLVPELLAERPDAAPPVLLGEAEQRRRLFEAVAAAVVSPVHATLVVVDDLHAVDRESARLLHYLLREHPGPGLLVLATGRHEEMDSGDAAHDLLTRLHARDAVDEIELGPLDAREVVVLARRLAGPRFTTARARRLVDETEGNPLFVLEALRAGWTATAGTTARVQSAVELRLARLDGPTRDLAALAATIGREFDLGVLRAAAEVDEDALVSGLDELWRRRLVRERAGGSGHGGSYEFSHGKIRQVVVDTTGPARRRRLHARVAAALLAEHAAATERGSARIAAHLEGAGDARRAVGWYRRAARVARTLHAHHEAIRLLERGLALLADQPAAPARDRRELALRTDLLAPLVTVAAYESPRMRATQDRILELGHALGTEPSPPLVRSLALGALTRSDFVAATDLGRRLAGLARRVGNPVLEVEAAYVLGVSAFWQADLEEARDHFRHALAHYDPAHATTHQLHYAQDPKVVCQGRLANTLWFLGEPDEARRAASEALAWARRLDHPFSRTIALTFAALLALDMGDEQALREHTAGLLAMEERIVSRHVVEAFRGHVAVLDGHGGGGLARVRAAVAATGPVGTAPGQHAFLVRVLLASCVAAGDTGGARAAADRLLAMGGPGRLWAPVARTVRARLVGGTAVERRPVHAPGSHAPVTQEEP
ncbi:ATP-binding protein [Actinomycetospora straminea]|uniref:ATP-binding protein n=1 Tax=Actinomycetospora straminea TaxID=663607 RepID=UPI002365766D|nr:AAA family ATPase [Actinomycetospora straminea]MDD7935114.1 AAA family ATPase [Actinomycetospora straminea]